MRANAQTRLPPSHFGIAAGAPIELRLLTGGLLSRVLRVDAAGSTYALKQYSTADTGYVDLRLICAAQDLARARGCHVPAVLRDPSGAGYVQAGGRFYVLNRFVEGRAFEPDTMPAPAARRMGEALARLQAALDAELPPGDPPALWSHARIEAYLDDLLSAAALRRHANAVDQRAYELLRRKRALLESVEGPPPYEPGWTHGDYHWRNVLFSDAHEVTAIIDFDTLHYFSPARDVMRCVALSFPGLGDAAFAFLAGYASARGVGPNEAVVHVELYRYLSTYRAWPLSARYLEPETYDPAWDDLIQPFPEWDWDDLSERYATLAGQAPGQS